MYLCGLAIVLIPAISLRIEAVLFARRASSVVFALLHLRVGTSSRNEALSRIPTLKPDGTGSGSAPDCEADECLFTWIPNSGLSNTILFAVARTRNQTLYSVLNWWGLRFWNFHASVNLNSGRVSYLSYHLTVGAPRLPDAVDVEVLSKQDITIKDPLGAKPSVYRQNTFARWPHQTVRIAFTPEAPNELVRHAFDLRLSCLWSFAGCRTWEQVLPFTETSSR